jgi:hypothetical protein
VILRDYADRSDLRTGDRTEEKRRQAIAWLGERWLLHPANSPSKGAYDNRGLVEHRNV